MDGAVYLTGNHMSALADNLDVIAANIANASTPGYKRGVCAFTAVLQAAAEATPSVTGEPALIWARLTDRTTDFSQGPVGRTGRDLDLALQGRGFFVVETPAGTRYTRKGRLYVSPEGELVDGAGSRFAAQSGSLRVPAQAAKISVDSEGRVAADDQPVGQLMLMDIPEPDKLVAEGWANFRNDGPPARRAVGSQVIQGAIEESNVSPVREMVGLLGVMRAYEAGARLAKRLDALDGELVKTAA
jgi:flagellar basal-body rod protein FlgF